MDGVVSLLMQKLLTGTYCRLHCRFARDLHAISKLQSSSPRPRSILCGRSWPMGPWKCTFVLTSGTLCTRLVTFLFDLRLSYLPLDQLICDQIRLVTLGFLQLPVQVAAHHLSEPEAAALYLQRAREQEAKMHYKEAEKLYIEAQEHDLAIKMYTKARQFDHVVELVSKYRRVVTHPDTWPLWRIE